MTALVIWIIGWMFTIGCYVQASGGWQDTVESTILSLVGFFIWPIVLGIASYQLYERLEDFLIRKQDERPIR